MKSKFVMFVLTALFSIGAWAAQPNNGGCQGNCPQEGGGDASANAAAVAAASAKAEAALYASFKNYMQQQQKQIQLQGQVGIQGNEQQTSLTFEAPVIPNSVEIKSVPNISMGGLYPSAPCSETTQFSLGLLGGGGGVGSSWTNVKCEEREEQRMDIGALMQADKTGVAATNYLCNKKPELKAALGKKCGEAKVALGIATEQQVAEQDREEKKRKTSGEQLAAGPSCTTDEIIAYRTGAALCK